jgi:hypothetical protein
MLVTNSEYENEEFRKMIVVPVFNIVIFLYTIGICFGQRVGVYSE